MDRGDDAAGLGRVDPAVGREQVDPLVDAHGQPADLGVPGATGRPHHLGSRHPLGPRGRLELGVLAVEVRRAERRLDGERAVGGHELLDPPLLAPLEPAGEPGPLPEAEGTRGLRGPAGIVAGAHAPDPASAGASLGITRTRRRRRTKAGRHRSRITA